MMVLGNNTTALKLYHKIKLICNVSREVVVIIFTLHTVHICLCQHNRESFPTSTEISEISKKFYTFFFKFRV